MDIILAVILIVLLVSFLFRTVYFFKAQQQFNAKVLEKLDELSQKQK